MSVKRSFKLYISVASLLHLSAETSQCFNQLQDFNLLFIFYILFIFIFVVFNINILYLYFMFYILCFIFHVLHRGHSSEDKMLHHLLKTIQFISSPRLLDYFSN